MANELKEKQQKLKKVRVRNIVLNLVCICLAGSGFGGRLLTFGVRLITK